MMTSIDVAAAVAELREELPAKISNIYDMPSSGVTLKILGKKSGTINLVIEPAKRMHLSRIEFPHPSTPSSFVMGLRKHLRGSLVTHAAQIGFDRIVAMETSRRKQVIAELLPRGVLVLVDEDKRILHISSTLKTKDRVLRRGGKYEPPPMLSKNTPLDLTVDRAREALAKGKDVARALVRGLFLPGELVEEVLYRIGIAPSTSPSNLDEQGLENIIEEIKRVYEEAVVEKKGYILLSGDEPITVVPFRPRGLSEAYDLKIKMFEKFSQALDEYFAHIEREEAAKRALESLRSEIAKLEKSRENALELLESYEREAKKLEELMLLLGEKMADIYDALQCARQGRICPPISRLDGRKVVIGLGGREIEISIDKDPGKYLVELNKRLGEIRAKIRRAKKALEEIETRIERLRQEETRQAARIVASIRRKEWYERYHWLITTNGFLVVAGRNADQNEAIVKRYLGKRDIFMHADIHGAPAVVIFTSGHIPPETDLREAATIAASYSRAWKEGLGAVDVYWVWGEQVSKSPPSGEYLSKGAFMVYGKRNYIRSVELRIAIGIGLDADSPVIIVGPEELVRRRSIVYAVLVPGDEEPGGVARLLKKLFLRRIEPRDKPLIDAIKVDHLSERIPGKSRIVLVNKGENSESPRGRLQENI